MHCWLDLLHTGLSLWEQAQSDKARLSARPHCAGKQHLNMRTCYLQDQGYLQKLQGLIDRIEDLFCSCMVHLVLNFEAALPFSEKAARRCVASLQQHPLQLRMHAV